MKIGFHIEYHTRPGQNLRLLGSIDALGAGNAADAPVMTTSDGVNWTLEIEVDPGTNISYSYFVSEPNAPDRHEWGQPRTVTATLHCKNIELIDRWHDRPADRPFYSTAFSDCIFRRAGRTPLKAEPGCLTLTVAAPMIDKSHTLLVCGNIPALGEWDIAGAAVMKAGEYPTFHITVPAPAEKLEYKFLVADPEGNILWETRDNREFSPAGFPGSPAVVNECPPVENPMPLWRGAGVAIPVFSLRSEHSTGIGDFADINAMADWASLTGMSFVQLLPVTDTSASGTWADSYPYNSISTFALNPVYIRLQEAGELSDPRRRAHYENAARELNALPEVDFEKVAAVKSAYLHELFAEQAEKTLSLYSFKEFVERNSAWLEPYVAFCVLRDRFNTSDMSAWGDYSQYSPDKIADLLASVPASADYYRWLQYHLDAQLRRVRAHCHSVGIALKGDIPIGVSRTSVDVWMWPELFNLSQSAGAPPDAFAINGQNWGFPTYNWERMAQDNYAWWRARLRKMADYFDAYRIDHLLGFFRIWQIPLSAIHGLLGIFYRALPFTPDELRYSYDFNFDRSVHTQPYITDAIVADLFGDDADYVKSHFLEAGYNDTYRLRAAFSTQRQIADKFPRSQAEAAGNRIYNGLLRLAEDVLFIEDTVQPGTYHPRIEGHRTFAFQALSPYEQDRYRALSHDFFYNRNDSFWRQQAMAKLPPLIDSTGMLCCGEDLGMIPACVPSVMEELSILSLKVQRMPDDPSREFADTRRYPYYCVATTSTHDMPGIRQWWEENPKRTQRYYNDALGLKGDAPYYAEPWICDLIITDHLASPAMLAILPLQDWLSIEGRIRRTDPRQEQINDPANPANRWSYRMHITLEQLLAERDFNTYLRKKILASGR